jgi:type I restriction enzyme M protein
MNNFSGKVSFIWSVADLLRGPYRPNQYKDLMLPMTVLRRLDCVLEPTKDKVLAKQKALSGGKVKNVNPILCRVTGVPFYNTSRYSFEKLKGDPDNIARNLTHYIKSFSTRAREIVESFGLRNTSENSTKRIGCFYWYPGFATLTCIPESSRILRWGTSLRNLSGGLTKHRMRRRAITLHPAR